MHSHAERAVRSPRPRAAKIPRSDIVARRLRPPRGHAADTARQARAPRTTGRTQCWASLAYRSRHASQGYIGYPSCESRFDRRVRRPVNEAMRTVPRGADSRTYGCADLSDENANVSPAYQTNVTAHCPRQRFGTARMTHTIGHPERFETYTTGRPPNSLATLLLFSFRVNRFLPPPRRGRPQEMCRPYRHPSRRLPCTRIRTAGTGTAEPRECRHQPRRRSRWHRRIRTNRHRMPRPDRKRLDER